MGNATKTDRQFTQRLASLAPPIFLVVASLLVILIWRSERKAATLRLSLETEITADQVGHRIEAWIDSRTAVIAHVARTAQLHPFESPAILQGTAALYIRLVPGMLALNFVDANWIIQVVEPADANRSALGKDLHDHPGAGVAAAVAEASRSSSIVRAPVVELYQGQVGIPTYHPIRDADGKLQGFVNGVFVVATLIDDCLYEESLRQRFRFELRELDGRLAYRHGDRKPDERWPMSATQSIRIVDKPWTLTVAPSPALLRSYKSPALTWLAAAGLGLSFLLTYLLRILLRRQAELRASQERYRLLVDNQVDMIVKVDAAGRFLYASPSYCATFGKTEEELLGQEFMPLVHADDRENTASPIHSLAAPPHTAYHEQRARTAQGWRWLAWMNSAILDARGEIESIVAVGRDITQQRQLEDELAQAQKLRAIGQLAGGVAHDFNNILHAVSGGVYFVRRGIADGTPVEAELDQLEACVERAATLTRQLLMFSRRKQPQPTRLALDTLVADMILLLNRVLGEDVELDYQPPEDHLEVKADRGQLEQIVMNLCVNARDAVRHAGGDRGEIQLAVQARVLDEKFCREQPWARPGRFITLSVTDRGQGMDEATRAQIFDPFFTTREVGAGTGLGLATVYGIVKQHNGLIQVVSEPDQGSTFTVYLPALDPDDQVDDDDDSPEQTTADPPVHDAAILIAEDEPSLRELCKRLLEEAGYRVFAAADGEEAVATYEAHCDEIDLVLFDVVMPRMGGRVAAARLRKLNPTLPVIFTSGYDPKAGSEEGEPKGGPPSAMLTKPYDRRTLLQAVHRALAD